MRDGVLAGFVPEIEGSDTHTGDQIVDTIVRTDHDQPIASVRSTAPAKLAVQRWALPAIRGRVPPPLTEWDTR